MIFHIFIYKMSSKTAQQQRTGEKTSAEVHVARSYLYTYSGLTMR